MIEDRGPDWAVELLSCPWCLSFWVALAVVGVFTASPGLAVAGASIFAISAVVGLISEKDGN